MELAALLIAVAALVLSTASVTLQITLLIKSKPQQAPVFVEDEFLTSALGKELNEPQKTIKASEDRRLQEAFDNPDVPYTGIDEEFNV